MLVFFPFNFYSHVRAEIKWAKLVYMPPKTRGTQTYQLDVGGVWFIYYMIIIILIILILALPIIIIYL